MGRDVSGGGRTLHRDRLRARAPEGDDLGLLGDVDGSDAIELGCGGAQFGIALAEQGANVTGVDISAEQLSHARDLAAERGVDMAFVQSSVTDLADVESGAFDLAFSAFAFQWVENLQACFDEAYRVLRPGDGSCSASTTPTTSFSTPRRGRSRRATSTTSHAAGTASRSKRRWWCIDGA
ncbi:class I SAM-dependent methyltransferase [Halolamina pelagica]|uniref:class I SAM-dependent methyltransferase n=1 Tax=Halolamina pelagica TaxID=699431 RepID=UPI0019555F1D|nr:class I SAM-dependent methyltransferase [Halolamina pelagica]